MIWDRFGLRLADLTPAQAIYYMQAADFLTIRAVPADKRTAEAAERFADYDAPIEDNG